VKLFKLIVVIVVVVGVFILLYGGDRLSEIYKSVEKHASINTPDTYSVTVENRRFSEALSELPEDVLIGDARPSVLIKFKKGEGFKVVISGVKEEYAGLFSMYEDYFRFSGISKMQNPPELKEIIDKGLVEYVGREGKFEILKAWDPEKGKSENSYALFYIDPEKWVIVKARYFLEGAEYVQAMNSYKKIGKYYLPDKILLKHLGEGTEETFEFKNYVFK